MTHIEAMRTAWLGGALAFVLLLVGCADNEDNKPIIPTESANLVPELVEKVLWPGVEGFAVQASALDEQLTQLCAAPSQVALDSAQESWRQANLAWQGAQPMMFGPASETGVKQELGYWPTIDIALEAIAKQDTKESAR
jgi:predicted lipoprotein